MDTPPGPPPPVLTCPQCHQPVQPEFYFCPNCGKALREKPLSTSVGTQAWIYALSIALPIVAYLAISYWPGVKYLRSGDEKAKQIGMIATVLLVLSTIVTFWLAIVWIQQTVQQSVNDIGNLGSGSSL
jgi:zinc-ribbon domain